MPTPRASLEEPHQHRCLSGFRRSGDDEDVFDGVAGRHGVDFAPLDSPINERLDTDELRRGLETIATLLRQLQARGQDG